MAELWAIIKALPVLIQTIKEVFAFIQKTFGETPEKFLRDSGEAFSRLNTAKTDQEKVDALKDIKKLIIRM